MKKTRGEKSRATFFLGAETLEKKNKMKAKSSETLSLIHHNFSLLEI
jgi:hypothetical protein